MAQVSDNAEIKLVLQTVKLNISQRSQNSSQGRILQLTAPKILWMSNSKFSKLTECQTDTDSLRRVTDAEHKSILI